MPWLEIFAVAVMWRMVRSWRRSKRSAPGAHNSRPYKASSQPTVQKPNFLDDVDPSRVQHDGPCEHCGARATVPMARTRLERRPWRIVWWCAVCGQQARAHCPEELVPVFAGWDKAGGMGMSMREVAEMIAVDLDELNAAVEDELL